MSLVSEGKLVLKPKYKHGFSSSQIDSLTAVCEALIPSVPINGNPNSHKYYLSSASLSPYPHEVTTPFTSHFHTTHTTNCFLMDRLQSWWWREGYLKLWWRWASCWSFCPRASAPSSSAAAPLLTGDGPSSTNSQSCPSAREKAYSRNGQGELSSSL